MKPDYMLKTLVVKTFFQNLNN